MRIHVEDADVMSGSVPVLFGGKHVWPEDDLDPDEDWEETEEEDEESEIPIPVA